MSKHLAERAREIIERIVYMTVATVSEDGEPWNSPVFAAYDEHYNFYWGSHYKSKHSRNIRTNGHAFLAIYDSTAAAGGGEGVYVKATAQELTHPIFIKNAHDLLQARSQPAPYWELRELLDDSPIRIYKAAPELVWMNADGEVEGQYVTARTRVDL